MATEITEGGQASLDAGERVKDTDRPLDKKFTDDFIDHDPADGQPEGGAGHAWFQEQFSMSFSDVDATVLETIATPTKLVTIGDLSGTHTGTFMGHAPTGKRFTVRNIQVLDVRDGKASARWGSTDVLGILEQLGLI